MADRIRVEQKDPAPLRGRPWTRHYDPGVPASLVYPDVPLHALLEDAARSHQGATGTIFFGRRRSYRSLQGDATFFSAGLRRLGVRKGDRVALMLPNCPQFLIAFFGVLRLGAVVVPCDPLSSPRELQHRLADSGAQTIVVLSRCYPTVKAARVGTALRNVIVTPLKEEMPPLARLLFSVTREGKEGHRVAWRGDPGTHAFRALLADAGEPVAAAVGTADLAVLQYTAGTTGTPKGVMLSHRALVASALQCRAWFTDLRDGRDAIMGVLPLFHGYGLTVAMDLAVQSASALILEPHLDIARVLKDIERHRPKIFPAAPRMYDEIVSSPLAAKHDLRSVETCVSVSAPLPEATARRLAELTGGHLVEGYGLTEAAALTLCDPIFTQGKQKVGSVGVALPDVECKVMDLETGTRELRAGEAGELVLRGPQLMDGYYERPDETAQTIRDGWLFTGDVAYMDGEGYVFLVDRKKKAFVVRTPGRAD